MLFNIIKSLLQMFCKTRCHKPLQVCWWLTQIYFDEKLGSFLNRCSTSKFQWCRFLEGLKFLNFVWCLIYRLFQVVAKIRLRSANLKKKIVGSQVRKAKLNKKMSDQLEKFFSFELQKRVKLKKGAMILFGKEKLSYIDEKCLKNF